MKTAELSKYQTLGNSYLVFDPAKNGPVAPSDSAFLTWVKKVCDVHYGIGSNGLLFGPVGGEGGDPQFRIINSDGSFAEFSGNGSRIFARYLLDEKYAVDIPAKPFRFFALSEDGAQILVEASRDKNDPGCLVTVLNVAPAFGPEAVAAAKGSFRANGENYTIPAIQQVGVQFSVSEPGWTDSTLLSIGNPHCVTFVSAQKQLPTFELLNRMSIQLSAIANRASGAPTNPVFGDGCNLQWAFVESRHKIVLRIVERGEGPTLASGSSAAAASIAARRRGLADDCLTVEMPGGSLKVTLRTEAGIIQSVTLAAPVSRIATIIMDASEL